MSTPLITLTTDFGNGSPYVAQMKAAIFAIHREADIVDITHAVPPQQIRNGAHVLNEVTPRFPPGTIHVAVIDPGVGSQRAIVYAQLGTQRYVCPDNGLLTLLCRRQPPAELRSLTNRSYWATEVSATFHGRDIMAPVAAHLSLGLSPEDLGPPHDALVELDFAEAVALPGKVIGQIESIDSFGNLITNITAAQVAECRELGAAARVACDEHETFGIRRAYSDVPEGTLVALVGSSGWLELAITGGNAAEMLRIGVGAKVTVAW